jgi:U3 small nucleolar RNA-associated protein 5
MSAKRKLPSKLGQPMVKQSAKVVGKHNLDESRTVVSAGGNAIKSNINGVREVVDISSDSSAAEEEDEGISEDESDNVEEQDGGVDVAMEDAGPTAEEDLPEDVEETGEPSLGDLVKANASEPIDVEGAFEDPSSRSLTYPQSTQIQPPSGASLGTVLSQALKTNDVSLLESCLHTTDVSTIRATIQRLDSPLAGTLLQKLAERLHRRPGRAGSLMVWVQWTLVTHGGYLATQRDLIKKLAELNKVIDTRSKGLQSLLSLKGKLDMLEAQIELRRSMQNQRRRLDEEDDDDGIIYVEGQESDEEIARPQKLAPNGDLEDISDLESEFSEDMPMTNGMIADSEDEEGDSEDGNLVDDEAEETDADSGDEDEVDHDDQDSQGEDEESDDAAQAPPPSKMQRIGGLFSRKR